MVNVIGDGEWQWLMALDNVNDEWLMAMDHGKSKRDTQILRQNSIFLPPTKRVIAFHDNINDILHSLMLIPQQQQQHQQQFIPQHISKMICKQKILQRSL